MEKDKREYSMQNSAVVSAGGIWYPFSETGAPTPKEVDDYAPFRAVVFENLSGEAYDIMLDAKGSDAVKKWRLPNGSALTIENRENIKFYNISAMNKGALQTAAAELKCTVRNY